MSKNQKAVDKGRKVGKGGSPPSGTKNEKARDEKKKQRAGLPKVGKGDLGADREGEGLH